MAKVTSKGGYSIDLGSLDLSMILSAAWYTQTDNVFRAIYPSGNYDEFRGSGFTYDNYGELKSGKIHSFASGDAKGKRLFVVEGADVSAKSIVKAAMTYSTDDDMRLFADVFKGNDTIQGGSNWDVLVGFAGHDTLHSLDGDDKIYAGEGNDWLSGGAGKDWLYGDGGNDFLAGEAGRDVLTGGAGRDTFVFATELVSRNVDSITDFSHKDDGFRVWDGVFKGMYDGWLAATRFKEVANARTDKHIDKGDRILYDKADGDLYFDRDGSGSKYDPVKFAEVKNNTAIDHTDFFIV